MPGTGLKPGHANRLITEPLEIPLESRVAVALLTCNSGDELNNTALEVAEAVDDPELLVALDEELVDEVDALEELLAVDAGVVGAKLSFDAPKPTSEAKSPATDIVSVLFWAATTRWPLLSSQAVACAFFGPAGY